MKNPVRPFSCVTPAGTSNELDVQNEWEENTYYVYDNLAVNQRQKEDDDRRPFGNF